MSRLPLPLVAAAAAAFAAVPATASAQYETRTRAPVASSEIREMVSQESRRSLTRASSGHDGRTAYLIVEKFRQGRRGGDRLVQQYRFDEVVLGRRVVPLSTMRGLHSLRIQRNEVSFVANSQRRGGDLSCRLQLRRPMRAPSCVAMGQVGPLPEPGPGAVPGPQPMPHPVRPDRPDLSTGPWASRAEVIRACGDAFSGNQMEAECLRAVDRARVEPVALIRACDSAMGGDQNELACIRAAAAGRGDVLGAIERCENAMGGDTSELECIRLVADDSRARSLIDACENAMGGDTTELQCVKIAMRLPGDVATTIDACERAAAGDSDELACIQAAYGRRAR